MSASAFASPESAAAALRPLIRPLGRTGYREVYDRMRAQVDARGPDSPDELWLVEHPPVYTLGLNSRAEHLHDPADIPVLRVDRGGQVTYHGPGQAVIYLLLDLRRRGLGVRALVSLIEQAVIELLAEHGVSAVARREAPGVYVDGHKVAALGLRVRRGCSYHGVALNVDMDLEPFTRIDPCGYPGLQVTQTRDLGVPLDREQAAEALAGRLVEGLMPGAVAATTESRHG